MIEPQSLPLADRIRLAAEDLGKLYQQMMRQGYTKNILEMYYEDQLVIAIHFDVEPNKAVNVRMHRHVDSILQDDIPPLLIAAYHQLDREYAQFLNSSDT